MEYKVKLGMRRKKFAQRAEYQKIYQEEDKIYIESTISGQKISRKIIPDLHVYMV